MRELLPAWLGALALAAVFSTEVDTCDAILFMLSTSAAKDFYLRFVNPGADDATLLRVARTTAVMGGIVGIALAVVLQTVIGALTIFYSLLVVTLFVPVVGDEGAPLLGAVGLDSPQAVTASALAPRLNRAASLSSLRRLISALVASRSRCRPPNSSC